MIDTVHLRKVVHICQKEVRFDSILEARFSGFQHCIEISQDMGRKAKVI